MSENKWVSAPTTTTNSPGDNLVVIQRLDHHLVVVSFVNNVLVVWLPSPFVVRCTRCGSTVPLLSSLDGRSELLGMPRLPFLVLYCEPPSLLLPQLHHCPVVVVVVHHRRSSSSSSLCATAPSSSSSGAG